MGWGWGVGMESIELFFVLFVCLFVLAMNPNPDAIAGDMHPDTAMSTANLAVIEARMGNVAEAQRLAEAALAIRTETVGKEVCNPCQYCDCTLLY